jgi:hypothetical protein
LDKNTPNNNKTVWLKGEITILLEGFASTVGKKRKNVLLSVKHRGKYYMCHFSNLGFLVYYSCKGEFILLRGRFVVYTEKPNSKRGDYV